MRGNNTCVGFLFAHLENAPKSLQQRPSLPLLRRLHSTAGGRLCCCCCRRCVQASAQVLVPLTVSPTDRSTAAASCCSYRRTPSHGLLLAHQPGRNSPSSTAPSSRRRQDVGAPGYSDGPAHGSREQGRRKLRQGQLGRDEVRGRLVGEEDRQGRSIVVAAPAGGDAILERMGHRRMVLG